MIFIANEFFDIFKFCSGDFLLAWKRVSCQHIVQDEYIDFRRCDYRFPDGTEFGPFYNYSRRDYVVIVATDTDGKYICVRQYRHGIERVTTEFCAGGIEREDGKEYGNHADNQHAELALDAAKRELMEETGYESDDWKFLMSIPSNATMADNYANIFVAKNCRKVADQNLDDTEYLNVHTYTRAEIDDMIKSGEFPQMAHVLALLLAS